MDLSISSRSLPRVSAAVPKGMVSSLPARKAMSLHGTFKRATPQFSIRGAATGGRSMLVVMAHNMSDIRNHQTAAGAPAVAQELQRMRNKVSALDSELLAAQNLLSSNEAARAMENEQLAALQTEMSSLQSQWVSDQQALQDTVNHSVDVEESNAALREVQGQAVQMGDRISKLQTLLRDQDETVTLLQERLRAAKPQLATVGAGSATLDDDLMASFQKGSTLEQAPSFEGLGGAWDISTPLGNLAVPTPAAASNGNPTEGSKDVMRAPKALGVTFIAATFAVAGAAGGIWGTVRRVAPKNLRRPLDFVASAAVTTLVASAAVLLG